MSNEKQTTPPMAPEVMSLADNGVIVLQSDDTGYTIPLGYTSPDFPMVVTTLTWENREEIQEPQTVPSPQEQTINQDERTPAKSESPRLAIIAAIVLAGVGVVIVIRSVTTGVAGKLLVSSKKLLHR